MTRATSEFTPPGRVPILGHLPAYLRDPLAFMTECACCSGGWATVRFGHRPFFIATNPDLIEAVLVTRHRSFQKSPGLRRSSILFGQGLLTAEGDFWRRQRKLIQPAFHRERIAAAAETMVAITARHLDSWQTDRPFDLHADLMHLTLNVAVQTLFGTQVCEIETVANALDVGQRAFAKWMHYLIMLPDWVPTPSAPRISKAIRDLDRVIYAMIHERRSAGGSREDLLSMLLGLEDAEDRERMSDRQLRDEILTIFLAGHETTALALTWAFHFLAQSPNVECRVREELDSVLRGHPPRPEDLPRLAVTEQVIREAMRLYPPAWVIGRQATEMVEIGGHKLRPGDPVIMPQYVVHRDARYFQDPDQFQPERWTVDFIRGLPKYAYFPFGGGPRVCIGSAFAMTESVLLLASIASRFRLSAAPDCRVELQPSFTLRPKAGVWMQAAVW